MTIGSAFAEGSMRPLPDLTEENIAYQTQRCAGFFDALGDVLLRDAASQGQDYPERERLLALISRSQDNADGMQKIAVILLNVLDDLTVGEAADNAIVERQVSKAAYLMAVSDSFSIIDASDRNALWDNDAAACAALATHIQDITASLSN